MDTELTHAARIELAHSLRRRYQTASSRAKKQILSEFIAVSGYHPKYAIHLLNAAEAAAPARHGRVRRTIYDDAAKQALIVLWEASDRICGKRLQPLLRILLPALERHGHLKLEETIRDKVMAMSAATIDRLLRAPRNATRTKKLRRVTPEIRRRIAVRTFADWNEPPPGSMEMDLVAHCGDMNRGSFVHSLVLTDIASGWTECAPLVVRESTLLVEALERVRLGLPFTLRALDVDNGSEFVNETMIQYCLRNGIELTRSRPYRKNDQAWIEQKNGAIVRKLLGYRRFEGIAAAQVLTRLYGASRLFVNFFQPSFKLAEKHRQGAQVTKRYHPPRTPCERLLLAESVSDAIKVKLREVGNALDPLHLLEEVRAMQSHLVVLADGGKSHASSTGEPDLSAFLASLSSAWRAGEIRPTHSTEAKPRYLRRIQSLAHRDTVAPQQVAPPSPQKVVQMEAKPAALPDRSSMPQLDPETERQCELQRQEFARRHIQRRHAFTLIWPLVCRRLEARPNINASELFDELRAQYPGRFHCGQLGAFIHRVRLWRDDARARGVVIGKRSHRNTTSRARRRPDPFQAHWSEMLQRLDADPDQTALELLIDFQARYPDRYNARHLRTLQRRLKIWRREAVQRLICEMQGFSTNVGSGPG
ncbi:MAG: DDE-type integrase/transposase/recombinase [Pseudomonadota bacterium]|nr:DDE-type integrase/transposase/recombinase [Pseudomonadota bacterium]